MPGYDRRRSGGAGGGGGGGGRRYNGGSGLMISPWETGFPGMQQPPNLMSNFNTGYQQQFNLLNDVFSRTSVSNQYGGQNKIRRLDMGNFNDHRGRDFNPPSLMGDFSQNYSRGSVQHRLGSSDRKSGSGYYPSESRERRRYIRPTQSNKRTRSRSRDRRFKDDKEKKSKHAHSTSKEESGEGKKEQEKSDEVEVKAEKAEGEANEKSETKDSEKKKEEEFPVECLYCHICDVEPFQTKRGFIRHLEAITHAKMAEAYHKKNATLMDYLCVSSKFAEMKRKDKLIRASNKKGLPLGRIVEQEILQNYLQTEDCCGRHFDSRYELHEHKLSISHLRRTFEKGSKEVKNPEENKISDVSVEDIDKTIQEAKEEIENNPLDINNIPEYTPSIPFGLHFIEKQVMFKCSLCKIDNIISLDEHCQSFDHYQNAITALNKEEEKKRLAKIKADEEIKKSEEKAKKSEEEKARKSEEEKKKVKKETSNVKDEMIILDEEKEDYDMMTDEQEPQSIMDTMKDEDENMADADEENNDGDKEENSAEAVKDEEENIADEENDEEENEGEDNIDDEENEGEENIDDDENEGEENNADEEDNEEESFAEEPKKKQQKHVEEKQEEDTPRTRRSRRIRM